VCFKTLLCPLQWEGNWGAKMKARDVDQFSKGSI
jgi:hypothetical protein